MLNNTNTSASASTTHAVTAAETKSANNPRKINEDGAVEWRGYVRLKPAKTEDKSDLLVFDIPLMDEYKLIGIINIPDEGQKKAPAYLKIKHIDSDDRSNKNNDQIETWARLKPTKDGNGEILSLQTTLFGVCEFVAIANIPDVGRDKAPVYFKVKPKFHLSKGGYHHQNNNN